MFYLISCQVIIETETATFADPDQIVALLITLIKPVDSYKYIRKIPLKYGDTKYNVKVNDNIYGVHVK